MIQWSPPYDNGSPIIAYDVQIIKSDQATYAYDLVNCDGSNADIVSASECHIPVSVLMASPFNYVWGQSISARLSASNIYGSSQVSDLGNGAILLTNPDSPLNFQENISARTPDSIALKWSEGLNNGGSDIIDYRISIA